MLRFFRSYNSLVIITILLIGVLTWLHVLGETDAISSGKNDAFMFRALNGWLANMPGAYASFGLFLSLLTAILLVFANARLHLIEKTSHLPALCYLLLIGGVPEIHFLNPVLIAAILLVAGFIILAEAFESERLSYNFFTVSALISFATFFCPCMYVYMLVICFAIAFWRPGYWREWVFSILGFVLPLFFAFSWFFLVEDDVTRMGVFFEEMLTIQRVAPSLPASTIVFFTLSIAVGVIAFGHLLRYIGSKKAIIRTRYYILMMTGGFTIGLAFIVPDIIPLAWYLLAFPMSFIISGYLANIKSARWGTVVLAVLFVGVMVAQVMFL